MKHTFIISSNRQKSIKKFLEFLKTPTFLRPRLHLKKKKKKVHTISILTSPHVNKNAQEQFCKKKHVYLIKIHGVDFNNLVLWIKSIKTQSFYDVHIKYCVVIKKKKTTKTSSKLNPDQLIIKKKTPYNYLRLLESFGNFYLTFLAQLD